MKRIKEYKTLFNVEGALDLKDLKKTYRSLVKQWHPDKFQDDDDRKEEAELMGQKVIDAYHFLVSMAPETKEKNLPAYKKTIDECGIENYKHKGLLLELSFTNGAVYEYFGVTPDLFKKLMNSDKQIRFAKRSIFHSFPYRQSKKALEPEMA
jgi:DnaJ-class molecular chaperone